MTHDELLEAFQSATLEPADFDHEAHVRLAWWLLETRPPTAAASAITEGLRRYTAALGVPDKYHETLTLAWLFLINERREKSDDLDGRGGWEAFRRANPDLLAPGGAVLDRYYRKETLGSALARRVFVLPDRALELPADDARAA